MKLVLPGGTGFIGKNLARFFTAAGHEVVVLSRSEAAVAGGGASAFGNARFVQWDGKAPGEWAEEIDGADVVINLAGRSVNCRYDARNRKEIMDSRIDSTGAIGQAIARAKRPPRVWLQSSTATI